MANNENLKPVRTKSEARERGRAGGKASGEARRKRADFRKTLNALLTAEIDSPEWNPLLESLGSDAGSSDQYGDDQRSTCRKCEGL